MKRPDDNDCWMTAMIRRHDSNDATCGQSLMSTTLVMGWHEGSWTKRVDNDDSGVSNDCCKQTIVTDDNAATAFVWKKIMIGGVKYI